MSYGSFATNAGSGGSNFAQDTVGGVLFSRIKLTFGGEGVASEPALASPLPVSNSMESGQMLAGGVVVTPKFAAIAASSSGDNTIVAAVTSKKIRVLAASFISNGTVNAKFKSGTAGADLTGLYYLIVNTGAVLPFNPAGWFESASGVLLNLNLSAAIAVGGSLTYIEVG